MIDFKELRWGNIISSPLKPEGWPIYSTDFEFIMDHPENYDPIPLSPEWLERFGFKKESGQDNFSYPEGDGSVYYLNYNDKHSEVHAVSVCHPMIDDSHTAFAWHVKYVHQLQNIFYCILGKELELNP